MTTDCRTGIQPDVSQPSSEHPGPALLAHEARVQYGAVPGRLDAAEPAAWSMGISGDCFHLQTGTGYRFHYRKGAGVLVERAPDADPTEEQLWLRGSTYAAIAAINGFMPVHASAVVWRGRVHAFSGPSGAGKSTLAAALGHHGLSLICDDTMVLDLSSEGAPLCLPGHKRLKLDDSALSLTAAKAREKVGRMIEKHYAEPPGGTVQQVLPLARICYLEAGDSLHSEPIIGAERIARLDDDHYTAQLYAMARGEGLAERLAHLGRIASRIPMHRLTMPRDPARFSDHVARLASLIKEEGTA